MTKQEHLQSLQQQKKAATEAIQEVESLIYLYKKQLSYAKKRLSIIEAEIQDFEDEIVKDTNPEMNQDSYFEKERF